MTSHENLLTSAIKSPSRSPRPASAGLAATALISGLGGVATLAFPLIEAVGIALGVLALVAGASAWLRSSRSARAARVAAMLGIALGTVALVAVISRVDKVIIPIDRDLIEQRRVR